MFVLQTWVNSYWHDFALDSELLEEFKDFVSQVSNLDDFSYIADEITFAVERQVRLIFLFFLSLFYFILFYLFQKN